MKQQKIFSLIGCASLAFVSFISSCQTSNFQNIEITKGYKTGFMHQVSEPSIAINPKNTEEIAAGSIIDNYHFSSD